MQIVGAEFPQKAAFLFEPAPYKVMYGGRGSAKSWSMARALPLLAARKKLFVMCGREIQRSIKDSVHKLLVDQIQMLGLAGLYSVFDHKIVNNETRSEFAFVGVRNSIAEIKSTEGIDIFWMTEARNTSDNTWETLLPTIRRDPPHGPFEQGSEVWIDFNPELTKDPTYQRWVVNPPKGSKVVEINWNDNPWFPENLNRQRLEMVAADPDAARTIWDGKTRATLAGAIYERELAAAIKDGRVNPQVKYDRAKGVIVVFDLGKEDMCSLWFIQQIGMEHNVIDFYENCGFDIYHYLEEIQRRGYLIKGIWLPHDGATETQAATKSIKRQCQDIYETPGIVRIIPRVRKVTRINLLRNLFPRMNFHSDKCESGLNSLAHYQFGVDPKTKQRTKEPLHNWASHAADSLGGYPVMISEGNRPQEEEENYSAEGLSPASESAEGWMS